MPYDPSNPSTPRNRVRRMIGDVSTTWSLLSDAEIDAFLPGGDEDKGSIEKAALACVDDLITRASHVVTGSEGGASAQLSQLAPQLRALRADLARKVNGSSFASGLLSAVTTDLDGNNRQPAFTRTVGDVAGAGDWPS